MKSPVTYQGGKYRLAQAIAELLPRPRGLFWDLCSGGGSVSLAMVKAGLPTDQVVMVDHGPWGLFWNLIGRGKFPLDLLGYLIDEIPADPGSFVRWLRTTKPEGMLASPAFLLLQASSFGGAAVGIKEGAWQFTGGMRDAASHWFHPRPDVILSRVSYLAQTMRGVWGFQTKVQRVPSFLSPQDVVYWDPPYERTSGYGRDDLDIPGLLFDLTERAPVFLSEAKPFSRWACEIRPPTRDGGMNGRRKRFNAEWLSFIPGRA